MKIKNEIMNYVKLFVVFVIAGIFGCAWMEVYDCSDIDMWFYYHLSDDMYSVHQCVFVIASGILTTMMFYDVMKKFFKVSKNYFKDYGKH